MTGDGGSVMETAAWIVALVALAAPFAYASDDDRCRFWRSARGSKADAAQSTNARSST